MSYKSLNPYSGILTSEYEFCSENEIDAYFIEAERVYNKWKCDYKNSFPSLLNSLSKLLEAKAEELSVIISSEMGKTLKESKSEVLKCASLCKFYAENGLKFIETEIIETEFAHAEVRFDPQGIVFAIMPWNYPFWQVFRCAVPALVGGNIVLLRHASNVPRCALAIEKLFEDAGFKEYIFKSLFISHDQVEKIVSHRSVCGVALTGSEKAGEIVGAVAGKHLKKSILELGGSDAFIVCKDADLDLAVENAVLSRMLCNGQTCIAAKRFIIDQSIYDEFIDRLIQKVKPLKIGNPLDSEVNIGPLARKDLVESIENQVTISVKQGDKLIFGNKEGNEEFYAPVILENTDTEHVSWIEEFFGPVFILKKAENLAHAIELANNSRFGLGVSIWTKNVELVKSNYVHLLEFGSVFINEIVKSDPRLPFGGTKLSGYGRELGKEGVREFLNVKTLVVK